MIWLSEGMEEVGSPGLREVIAAHREAIEADACLWESYYRSVDGEAATIGFGSRGVLNVELSVRLLDSDTHSAMAGVYRSAASLLTRRRRLADRRRRPGPDSGLLRCDRCRSRSAMTKDRRAHACAADRRSTPPSVRRCGREDRRAIVRRWLYEPSFNLASIHAGPDDS